jgi:hypothetical protein
MTTPVPPSVRVATIAESTEGVANDSWFELMKAKPTLFVIEVGSVAETVVAPVTEQVAAVAPV